MPQLAPLWTFLTETLVGKVILAVAINYGLSKLSQAMADPNDAYGKTQVPAQEITSRGTIIPRQIIYGQARTGGFVTYFDTGGPNNSLLVYVITVAGHEVDSITDIYFDNQVILASEINASSGVVSTAAFVDGANNPVKIWKHLGTATQTVDANVSSLFPVWTSAMRGKGIAYIVVQLQRNTKVFPNGAPNNIYAIVKGRKLYDPRLDSTNGGSGSHRYNNASTWAWSNNWALAVRDYITGGSICYSGTPTKVYGANESDARINDAYIIAAANIADESCAVPTSSTQARYTCDIVLSTGESHKTNLAKLLGAGAGTLAYVSGKYRLFAGAYSSPAVTLGPDDVLGSISITTSPAAADIYNRVSGTFYDPARGWTPNSFPSRTDATYEANDGGLREKQIILSGTTDSFRAQRIAELILNQSRQKTTIKFSKLSMSASAIGEFDTFNMTLPEYGWEPIVLRCTSWEFVVDSDGMPYITIEAREEISASYDTPIEADYLTSVTAGQPSRVVDGIDAPTSFTAAGTTSGIQFSWTNPDYNGFVIELWEYTSATPFASATKIWEGKATAKLITKTDTTTRYYWIRARTSDRQFSSTTPSSNGLPASAAVAPSALTATISPGTITDSVTGASDTTGAATVTPTGGTAPYTYAWSWDSGGTGIAISTPSAASTTFVATSMAPSDVRTGTAKCIVTDNVSQTYTVYVSVSISRQAFTLSASPSSLSQTTTTGSATTASTTATPSGGTAAYSYSWARISGDASITIGSSSAATTTFSRTGMTTGTYNATFRCTATEATGYTATADVTVSLTQQQTITSPFTAWHVKADVVPLSGSGGAGLSINSDGTCSATYPHGGGATSSNNGTTTGSNWYGSVTSSIGSSYWARCTPTSGSFTSNTMSTWANISTNLQVQKTASSGTSSVTFTIEIATDSAGSNIVLTSTGNILDYIHSS